MILPLMGVKIISRPVGIILMNKTGRIRRARITFSIGGLFSISVSNLYAFWSWNENASKYPLAHPF